MFSGQCDGQLLVTYWSSRNYPRVTCWSSIYHQPVIYWSHTGRLLVNHWTSIGKPLVIYWSLVIFCWSSIGHPVVIYLSIGHTLVCKSYVLVINCSSTGHLLVTHWSSSSHFSGHLVATQWLSSGHSNGHLVEVVANLITQIIDVYFNVNFFILFYNCVCIFRF